jgi:hypothetical protein
LAWEQDRDRQEILFRILLILLAALLIYRLITALFRSKERDRAKKVRRTPRGKQVGEGKIVKDEPDEA